MQHRPKPSPWGEGGSPSGLTDVGCIKFPSNPKKRTGSPPHPAPSGPPSVSRRGLGSEVPTPGEALSPLCRGSHCLAIRFYRSSSVSANAEPLSRGMTATGSHEYFYSLRGAQPPGEGFSLSRQFVRRFIPLIKYRYLAGEACLAPTVPRRELSQTW